MDTGTFRGLVTLALIIAFIGIVGWAYSKRRRDDFDEAANLPFADEETPTAQPDDAPKRKASRHAGADEHEERP